MSDNIAETHNLCIFFVIRWQYLGRVQVLSRWVFTWWSRAASPCSNRPSCKVCHSPSRWRAGEEPSTWSWHLLLMCASLKCWDTTGVIYVCLSCCFTQTVQMFPACSQTTQSWTIIFPVFLPDTTHWSWGKTSPNRQTALWATSSACCLSLRRPSWPPRWKHVGRRGHKPTLAKFRETLLGSPHSYTRLQNRVPFICQRWCKNILKK